MATTDQLTGMASAALLVWLYLLIGHGGYWRTDQRLPGIAAKPRTWPGVVAIVPARNEADLLPQTLPTLLAQDYPGEFQVVLVDDGSDDGTADVARMVARAHPATGGEAGRDLAVVRAGDPPAGWAGKVWAMAEGVVAAEDTQPPAYVLFTDADIAHAPETLADLVRAAEGDRRDLVSQMAMLRARTGWERALVPAFVYFFAQLYPMRRVNRPGARTAAAAGGCALVRWTALAAAGGVERISGALIDDVALARLIKRRPGGGRVWLGLTSEVVSRRAYPRLADLWAMVARSAYTQLRHSPLLLVATVAGLLLVYVAPPAAALGGAAAFVSSAGSTGVVSLAAGLAAWLVMTVTYVPTLRLYRLPAWRAPFLPFVALLYAAMTADSARRHLLGRGGTWKGRTHRPRRSRSAT